MKSFAVYCKKTRVGHDTTEAAKQQEENILVGTMGQLWKEEESEMGTQTGLEPRDTETLPQKEKNFQVMPQD